jgi:uncharacterized protein (TIGR02147 family)
MKDRIETIQDQYRELLKQKLMERLKSNSKYSLRAFARDLFIEPGQMSRVLNGKKNISIEAAKSISEKLFKSQAEKEEFLNLVEYSVSRNQRIKNQALSRLEKRKSKNQIVTLELEKMRMISNWYHVAILDLSLVKGAVISPARVASFLGISQIEAKDAIERLLTLGLLKKAGNKIIKSNLSLAAESVVPSKAIRNYHQQILQKASLAIEEQPIEERYFRAKTMAIRKSDLNLLKTLVNDFMDNVAQRMATGVQTDTADSLYQINVNFFDLKKRSGY